MIVQCFNAVPAIYTKFSETYYPKLDGIHIDSKYFCKISPILNPVKKLGDFPEWEAP